MILKEGKTQEELMQALEEMDSLTSMDSFIKNEESVHVMCTRKGGRLKNWSINCEPELRSKPVATGTTLRCFLSQLENVTEESVFNDPDYSILCYLSTSTHKQWNGDVISNWVEIIPGVPYEADAGEVRFSTKQVVLPESDFAVMKTTGLAFYHKATDVYYPFTETAYKSMGRLFDSAMAFREVESHLLGTALILAEKISLMQEFKIISRSKNNHVRPVLSVAGNRYALFSQKVFFETLMNYAATTLGVYEVSNWVIEDTITTLELEYANPWEDYYFKLCFSTGDVPSIPFCAELKAVSKEKELLLVSNNAKHVASFTKKNIPELMKGIPEAMQAFRDRFARMQNSVCEFDERWMSNIYKILGKNRVSKLDKTESGRYMALELWNHLIKTCHMTLNKRHSADLEKAFSVLFQQITDNLEDIQEVA